MTVSSEVTRQLRALSRAQGVTLFMTLLAAWQSLLYRLSGQADISVGTAIANRTRAETERLIGFFVNTLVLRTEVRGEESFRELLGRVREVCLGAYAHQDVPFEMLVEEMQPERALSHSPLFQVMFTFQNAGAGKLSLGELKLSGMEVATETTKVDVTLAMAETSDGLVAAIEYCRDVYDKATIERMVTQLGRVLETVATEAEVKVSEIGLLSEEEERRQVEEWNETKREYARDKSVHEIFEEQVERTPDAVAVSYRAEQVTYEELNERANQLAHHLRGMGVEAEVPVGICLERSVEMIVSLLAILKAGGAYVPLDAEYPLERLSLMMEDAGLSVVVTQESMVERLPSHWAQLVCTDRDGEIIKQQSRANLPSVTTADNLAYVMYTSGSSGTPKGVAVLHRGVVRLVSNVDYVELSSATCILQLAPLAFDASTFEIWGALLTGGRCVLAGQRMLTPSELEELIREEQIETMWLTASLYNAVAEERVEALHGLRQLLIGGEALSVKHVRAGIERLGQTELINGYGPTEATTFACTYRIKPIGEAEETVAIGKPMANTEVYVLDHEMRVVPVGVAGELYIGGDGLARGYLNQASLTAEKFVPHPYSKSEGGERLYRTGDIVRYRAGGEIEFIGRADEQVKVRGYRIELGEVETVLLSHGGVREAVVLAREDEAVGKRLVAYVVPNDLEHALTVTEMRSYLREKLPEYMIPSVLVLIEEMPLTPNGKVDRRALPAADARPSLEKEYVAPRNATEEIVAAIWSEVLDVERVGIHDNFFDLGGHSLVATQVVSRLREAFQIELPLQSLFEFAVMVDLAAHIEAVKGGEQGVIAPPIVWVARDQELPLSFAQQRLWFLDQLDSGGAVYNVPAAVRLTGQLNFEALEHSLSEIIRRHEALRTTFPTVNGRPIQQISEAVPLALPMIDLSAAEESEREAEALRVVAEEAGRPFNLASGPLFRAGLLRLAADEHVLWLSMHHIISDGWSIGVLVGELSALYEAGVRGEQAELSELAVQYADFAVWQREWLQGEVLERQLSYWRDQLSGTARVLELPADHRRPAAQSYRGGRELMTVSSEVTRQLRALSRAQGVTLFMTLLAAWQSLLYRLSGQADISVGTAIANRTRAETERLIGFFVNTLVLRTEVRGEESFRELLGRVREVCLGAYAHQDVPFEMLVEEMQPERALSHSPLFQVMFILQNAPGGALELEGLSLSPWSVEDQDTTAKFDITLSMIDTPDGLIGAFEYSSDLFEASTIERMVANFEKLLASAVETPDASISALGLLSEGEESEMLQWCGSHSAFESSCLHHFFERQAELNPDRIGLQFRDQSFTYRELNEAANQLAHLLISRRVQAETLVGICLERTPQMIISMLAVLKAGGAYVPLDPAYPAQRLAAMIADAGMALVITDSTLQGRLESSPLSRDDSTLFADPSIELLCLDQEWEKVVAIQGIDTPSCPASPGNLAWVIYTSGSTGRAKGVAIVHRGAAALLHWAQLCYRPEDFEGVLASTSICFDLSIFEIFVTLCCGGRIILVETVLELMEMEESARDKIRLINTVPSAMAELVRLGRLSDGLRVVNLAGEALSRSLVESVYEAGTVERVMNLYGPSEATTYSTYGQMAMGVEVSIGRAVENTEVYVLDGGMRMTPVGVVGELYIGGEGLARGYLNRAELTAEKFVPNPYGRTGGERLYKTGDVVRWLPRGELEYIGRADQQVKLRGYRIELGEIETVLRGHAGVREAVVLAREGEARDKRLVAYVITNDGAEALTVTEMRSYLRDKLPEYMIPSALMALSEMPMTPNGKIDRRALPVPDGMRPELKRPYVAPRTATEMSLAAIWTELLRVEKIGIHDNFFELGGHSLLATQVISKVRELFAVEVALRAIFEEPTVAGLAQRVELAQRKGVGLEAPPLVKVEKREELPLSFAQQRLWFLDRLLDNSAVYNLATALRLSGTLHVDALQRTLTEIVRRHEVLRTHFPIVNGEPVQEIGPAVELELRQFDLDQGSESEVESEILRVVSREAAVPFDLAAGPVLRACLLRLGPDSHVLLLMMHHIAIDGWSMGVLVRELTLLYTAYSSGETSPLEELSVQYSDYAVWQREWLQGDVLERQIAYWRQQLGGVLPALELPTDRPRPAIQSHHGTRQSFMLPADLADGLRGISRSHGATLFMVLLAAWQTLLSRYSGQEDVIVGTDIANRNRVETEALIGFFVNQLVLRTDLSGDPSFVELLGRVREVALGAYSHQDVPFEKLVEELQPVRDLSRSPMFQVKLDLQNVPTGGQLQLPGLTLSPIDFESDTAKFDLLMTMFESGQDLGGILEYNTDLFDATTIARMLEHFGMVLEAIVAKPEQRISELPLVGEGERRQLLDEWNQTGEEYPVDKLLHQLFEEQTERSPNAVAVVFEDAQLTYAELNARANQLAHHLKSLGVGPETVVGICVERSLELVVGLLGILKAGGAYVPLDASYPLKRLSFMMEDAQVSVLLTQESLIDTLPTHWGHTICLDGGWNTIAVESTLNPSVEIDPQHPAYILYTSGSTGSPKGVVISHEAICQHMHWMHSTFPLDETDRVLQKTPISFDASVWEFYAPLMAGAMLVVARPDGHQDPAYLLATIYKHEVTILQVVPTMLRLLVEGAALAECHSLKRVFCGGEALTRELQSAFNAVTTAELVNVYGPTEATIHASFAVCAATASEEQPRPSIGRPIANARLYIMDHHQHLVPVGVAGELYISGAGLARGYAHRADLTAEKFVPHPFSELPGERMYKTGDLVRYLADGQIEFLGRVDHQVKLRGFRIELGEIEAAIGAHPAVRQAVVVIREDAPGDQCLVAYLAIHDESDLTVKDLRHYLREKLPEYMIPAAFVMLDALPLTPNGKVERRALPAPEAISGDQESFIAPRDAIELQLAEIWEDVLGVRAIGVMDNFFDLGGNSLLAVRLMAQIEIEFGQELSLSTLFQNATIEGLATALRNKTGGSPWSHVVALQSGTERPLFCVHAAGGNVFSYVELSRQLGTIQPTYGLQAAGLDGKRGPLTTIEEMAAVYIKEMREVQPEGPYLLGGWSFGGAVAFEMAQQLRQQGEELALLAMFDSSVPVNLGYDYANDHAALVIMFARDLMGTPDDDLLSTYTELQQRTEEEHLQYVLDQAISARVLPPGTGVDQMLPLLHVYKANFLARENYRPQPYAGRITLFRAGELVDEQDQMESLGWGDLAEVDVKLVPGSHYTMMRKPNVETLAESLRAAIGQAPNSAVRSRAFTALE